MKNAQDDRRRNSRRTDKDRRTGQLKELFQHAVFKGTFIDARRKSRRNSSERRKDSEEMFQVCLN